MVLFFGFLGGKVNPAVSSDWEFIMWMDPCWTCQVALDTAVGCIWIWIYTIIHQEINIVCQYNKVRGWI